MDGRQVPCHRGRQPKKAGGLNKGNSAQWLVFTHSSVCSLFMVSEAEWGGPLVGWSTATIPEKRESRRRKAAWGSPFLESTESQGSYEESKQQEQHSELSTLQIAPGHGLGRPGAKREPG